MKKLLTLFTLLLTVCSGAWATDPVIWNLEKTYSSASETELNGDGDWSYKSNVYTYSKALSNAALPNQAGDEFSLTEGLTFTVAAGKLKLGKGYMLFDDTGAHTVTIPTTANQYVNLVVGVGTANKTISVSGGDIDNFTVPVASKAFSINIKATGSSLTIGTPGSSGFKLCIYQIAVIDESDVVAPVVPNYGEGSYYKGLSLSLSTETEGTSIVYKNDSQTRGFSDLSEYSSAISMTNTGTRYVTTCATKSVTGGKLYSDLKTYIYTIVGTLPTPVATPAAGTYNSTQNVVLSVEDMLPNGVIRYTTNGDTPSSSSPAYTDPIEVSADKTIKAYLFESTGNSQKSSMLTAAYTIVSLTDPSFSLSAISIPSNSTAQIKVGDNDGLDGVTLSNIAYGTDGIVTVNATTGVVTPVTAGTTTITFDTDATVKYNSSTGNEFTITVTTPKCATPTITKGAFNFAHKGYEVTIENNEDGSTLYYSTNNEDWTEYTDVLYATTTTHYYAKSVKASYDDSDVADNNVTNTFNGEKKYIAWVYESGYKDGTNPAYDFDTDEIVIELKKYYNVVPVVKTKSTTLTASDDIGNANLIVSSEAVTGKENLAKSMKAFVGVAPMLHMKLWSYTSGRWDWASAAANPETDMITPERKTYKVLDGVAFDADDISMFDDATGTRVQNVVWDLKPANNVDMARSDGNVAMHAIIDNDHLDKQFFAIGLSCVNNTKYSNNAKAIVKNAAAMLIAGTERLDAEMATVSGTITDAEWNTFSSSYPLDLSTITNGTAYVATTKDNTTITLTETSAKVAAGEGLMIKGTAGATFTISTTTDDATFSGTNLLVGLPNGGTVTANDNNYVFAWPNGSPSAAGFYFVNDAEPTLGANKAYLHAEGATPAKLGIIIDDSETDGIKSVQGSRFTVNGEAYNLAGQKVGKDYKGIVIVNGKKIVRK